MFPAESSSPLSQDDLIYLEGMFSETGPTEEEIDTLFLSDEHLSALQDGYPALFFLPEPEMTIPACKDLGIDGRYLQRFLALRHPLEARTLASLRLVPFDARSIAHVLLPYYRRRYPCSEEEETWAFFKSGSRVMRGVIVHPSTKMKGRWQLTYFDRDGLDCDETRPKDSDVLLGLFSRRYIIPAPEIVDQLALHSWKCHFDEQ
ncbi:MAG TPA: hypothetical protein VFV38_45815 [Ktedonobacteraceae bacterium]|nr:hypothetical protein [Ktedonobacteraceae bacterium]